MFYTRNYYIEWFKILCAFIAHQSKYMYCGSNPLPPIWSTSGLRPRPVLARIFNSTNEYKCKTSWGGAVPSSDSTGSACWGHKTKFAFKKFQIVLSSMGLLESKFGLFVVIKAVFYWGCLPSFKNQKNVVQNSFMP